MSTWRLCSTCKTPIALGAKYFVCNVSTCQRPATNFAFCTVDCWDAHVPTFRHKDSWAEERKAPTTLETAVEPAAAVAVAKPQPAARAPAPDKETLIVASKLKAYITAKSGMNTSASVMDILSDKVRLLADQAIEKANREGRKTVMDRDF